MALALGRIIFDPEVQRFDVMAVDAESEVLFGLVSREGATLMTHESGGEDKGTNLWLRVDHAGVNGFLGFPLAPQEDIPYQFRFTFREDGQIALDGLHDGYPSYEAWVYRDGEEPISLYKFSEGKIDGLRPPMEIRAQGELTLSSRNRKETDRDHD